MQRHTYQTRLPYPCCQISILIIKAQNIRKKGSKGALLGAQNGLQMKTLLNVWLDHISGAVSATDHPCRQGAGTWRACGLYSAHATGNQKKRNSSKTTVFGDFSARVSLFSLTLKRLQVAHQLFRQ